MKHPTRATATTKPLVRYPSGITIPTEAHPLLQTACLTSKLDEKAAICAGLRLLIASFGSYTDNRPLSKSINAVLSRLPLEAQKPTAQRAG